MEKRWTKTVDGWTHQKSKTERLKMVIEEWKRGGLKRRGDMRKDDGLRIQENASNAPREETEWRKAAKKT